MKEFPNNHFDAVVTDPPYALVGNSRKGSAQPGDLKTPYGRSGPSKKRGFMGKEWDGQIPGEEYWREALRVAKPGAHLLAFGGTRTYHRLACAIEDAGWELRDSIGLPHASGEWGDVPWLLAWVYGSGFPKSHDVSKAIDKNGGKSVSWFVEYIEHVCKERGIHNREITALFPSKNGGMTGWFWNKRKGKQNITPEQFNRIRDFLGLPFADLQEAEREVIGEKSAGLGSGNTYAFRDENKDAPRKVEITAPATQAAQAWHGWGTALKPAWEPVILARKPLQGTVAENVLTWGTGGMNIDGCRVKTPQTGETRKAKERENREQWRITGGTNGDGATSPLGRWPANLILSHHPGCVYRGEKVVRNRSGSIKGTEPSHTGDENTACYGEYGRAAFRRYGGNEGMEIAEAWDCHADCPAGMFPDRGKSTGGRTVRRSGGGNVGSGKSSEAGFSNDDPGYGDSGSAARFFYCAKASKRDREEGLDNCQLPIADGQWAIKNHHPTVKPMDLMRYLIRLVTPPGGVVLDPFMGSGSTGKAAVVEGMRFVGIEKEAEYLPIARGRVAGAGRGAAGVIGKKGGQPPESPFFKGERGRQMEMFGDG